MRRVMSEVRYTVAVILAVDAAVVALACLIAVAVGSFERGTVGFLILGASGLVLLAAAASSGSSVFGGTTFAGGVSDGLGYSNAMHAEMLWRQGLQDDAVRKDLHRKRVSGIGITVIGLSLFVIGFAVVG